MEYSRSLSRLQRLCSKAEYCRADIYRKALKDLDGDAAEAARLVDELIRDRYVDDARYAQAFAREKASLQGWGPVKIRFQLRAKGVSDAVIAAALEGMNTPRLRMRLLFSPINANFAVQNNGRTICRGKPRKVRTGQGTRLWKAQWGVIFKMRNRE